MRAAVETARSDARRSARARCASTVSSLPTTPAPVAVSATAAIVAMVMRRRRLSPRGFALRCGAVKAIGDGWWATGGYRFPAQTQFRSAGRCV